MYWSRALATKRPSKKKSAASAASSSSRKTGVIEILFERFWPPGAGATVTPMIVTNVQVQEAIEQWNNTVRSPDQKRLSASNPANFLKDFIRKSSCNKNWPDRLKRLNITARQRYGDQQVLEFVPYRAGDAVPFPDRYLPAADLRTIEIESLSIPRQARALGRTDEPWLIQVAVGQRIAQTHLAAVSPAEFFDLTHLQMSVKTQPEIDAVYVAAMRHKGNELRALVTCEAKQYGERLLEDQIREQVAQGFNMTMSLTGADAIDAVLPIAMQVVPNPGGKHLPRLIYLTEFKPITRKLFKRKFGPSNLHELPLILRSSAYYLLTPGVRGVSCESQGKNGTKKSRGQSETVD